MEHKIERFDVKGYTLQGRSAVLDILREDTKKRNKTMMGLSR